MPASLPSSTPEFILTPLLTTLFFLQGLFVSAGLFLLLRKPSATGRRVLGLVPGRLTASPYQLKEIFLAGAFGFGGAVMFTFVSDEIGRRFWPPPADGSMGFYHVLMSAGFQLGLAAGLAHAWFWHLRPGKRATEGAAALPPPAGGPRSEPALGAGFGFALREGIATFFIVLPAVWLSSILWQVLLDRFGIEAPPQDIVLLFAKSGDWLSLGLMIGFAVLVAPCTEETVFRIGLFRWLRGRISRPLALLLPALFFAFIHGSIAALVPLVVLSLVFSFAYERTGEPAVPIVAHALFNLNTLVLVLAGFPTTDKELRAAIDQLQSLLN